MPELPELELEDLTGPEATRAYLAEEHAEAILFDGCDAALVGFAQQQYQSPLAVYDYELLVKVFEDQGMDEDDALEWVSFNVEGLWAGPGTPLILHRPPVE